MTNFSDGTILSASQLNSAFYEANLISVTSVNSASGVVTIDLSTKYKRFLLTLTENVTAWNFINLPATNLSNEIRIEITQNTSSAYTCASPATSGMTAGGAWVNSSTLGAVELLGVLIDSSGNRKLHPYGVYV